MSDQMSPSSSTALAAVDVLNAVGKLKVGDRPTAEAIAVEVCKYGTDLLALLELPFTPELLATVLVSAGNQGANGGPNTLAGWVKYRAEEAPQAVERLRSALAAAAATAETVKKNVSEVIDGLPTEGE